MTTIDLLAPNDATLPSRYKLPRALRRVIVVWRRRRRRVRLCLELQQLDERLLYDIGVDPLNLRASLEDRAVRSMLFEPMRRQFDDRER